MALKIIFMGTPDFAVSCLKRLIEDGHEIVLVVTQADKPKGRKLNLTPPPVKEYALTEGLDVFQPEALRNSREVCEKLAGYNADVAVVVAYGRILPPEILSIPKYGCINVHASLLPKYRGAAPIQWSVIDGESETGVTTMYMDAGLDTGDMLLKRKVKIPMNMTSGELHDLLAAEGAKAISDTLKALEEGSLTAEKQDDSISSYAPTLSREISPIDWNKPAWQIHNFIRGLNPWPAAKTTIGGRSLKIYCSKPVSSCNHLPGTVIENSPFTIACGENTSIEILEVQLEGTKRMSAADFLRGHPIKIGRILPD
ncbi:MAG TPA: methionyl-tRNA formyltransferase [Ruminococcaceae bacterium]|nr:methionyl-tRNA formyltransferase [Oscillospiraceae bacterium]